MLTPKQAATRIGVSDSLIYEWCASGVLPHYRCGRPGRRGKILIDEAELDTFLVSCR
jgi:excisionase family DNA binding protein